MKLLWILLALTLCGAASAEVYRWTDKDGKVHYSDARPLDTDAQTRRLYDSRIETDKLPYETRKAAERFPLTLYVSEACGQPCTDARQWLQKRKAPFAEKVLKTTADGDAFKAVTGKKEPRVPTLSVGSQVLEGFEGGAWGAALDTAGYPK